MNLIHLYNVCIRLDKEIIGIFPLERSVEELSIEMDMGAKMFLYNAVYHQYY